MKIRYYILYALLFVAMLIFFSNPSGCTKRYGATSKNISNQWVYKFRYLDGKVVGLFTANKDEAKLIYSSNLENGTIDFQLFNSKGSLLLTFPANNTTDTIKGVFVKGEGYKVIALATDAKGRFDFKME